MTIDELKNSGAIIFECISGSRSYGLDTANSDTDIKGVYIAPKDLFYSLSYPEQINNESNDIVYYELRKFVELLSKNNPNILEMLNVPQDCILYQHPLYEEIVKFPFVTKMCKESFAGYAFTQIRKAKGLNKKILNPVGKERKSLMDFCFVNYDNGAIPLSKFLEIKKWDQKNCGLVNIPHMKEMYGLYYGENKGYSGVFRKEDSNQLCLSSILKGEEQIALLSFNKEGYSVYCKEYKEYWEWVEKRNDVRYENTIEHGKNYDAKNMMHTFRLLQMALEIAESGKVNVRRMNREELLFIKQGNFTYDELVEKAEVLKVQVEEAFEKSNLPEGLDLNKVNELLVRIRSQMY
ncbi:MAG: nucleotidyltransferase domain-containing protein [Bacteroidetes bacterium]|nr:nucleotidyltransferase domain-containing protein [Bacteroidota bacterium]